MKKIILLILITVVISCENNQENEHYNFNHLIRVDFLTKQAWQGFEELKLSSEKATSVCTEIIIGNNPTGLKYSLLCLGGNDTGLHFVYLYIENSDIKGMYLAEYDEKRILVHNAGNYIQSECNLKWIISKN